MTIVVPLLIQPEEEEFSVQLARLRRARRQRRRNPVQFARAQMPVFLTVQDDPEAAAKRWAQALQILKQQPVTIPQAVINENRLRNLLTQVKLRHVEPEVVLRPTAEEIVEQPEEEIIEEPVEEIIEEPEEIQPVEEPEIQPEVMQPAIQRPTRVPRRRRRKKQRRPAFVIEERIEVPDVAVEPIDTVTVQRPTRAQVRALRRQQQRQKTSDEAAVESTDTNVVGTAEPLFTADTQHDVGDEPTLEDTAENPMRWKEWLADQGLSVSEVLVAWSATGAVTSGMVALTGAAATPFIGSLFVPVIASALLAPVARKITGTGVSAMSNFIRHQAGIRRTAQVNTPSVEPPTAEQRAQVRSAARKMGSFMWNNMTSVASAVGLAGSAGQVASAALGIVGHATSPEVVAEAIRLGLVLSTEGLWGVPWWALRAGYNVGTSRVGITIAARWVQRRLGWDRVGGEVGAFVQQCMQDHEVGEGRVFSAFMSEGLKEQIRVKFGEQAYQDFVETSWADITSFTVREYANMTIEQGSQQMTVEGARAAAQVYEGVKDSGALEAAVQTLAEARDLAQTATAQALDAGKTVTEAMREGTVKMWEAVTGSEAVAESTAFVLQESEISAQETQQLEEIRRTQTIERFREAQKVRNEAKAARALEHEKRHVEALARYHERRIKRAEERRKEVEMPLTNKLDDEIVQDTIRKQELESQLDVGAITQTEYEVSMDQLMTPEKKAAVLDNLAKKGLKFGGALTQGFDGLKIKPQAATVGKMLGGMIGAARQTWVNRIVGTDRTEIIIKDARTWERMAATGRLQSVFTRVTETVVTEGSQSEAFAAGQATGEGIGQIGLASAGTASQRTQTVLTFSKRAYDALPAAQKEEFNQALKGAISAGTIAASQVAGETLATAAGAAINNIDNVSTVYTTGRNSLRYAANVMGAMGDHDQAHWMGWIGDGVAHLVNDYTPDLVGLQNEYLGLGEVDLGQVAGAFMRDRYILRTGQTTAELAADAANKILFGTHVSDDQKGAAREALEQLLIATFTTADAAGQYVYGTRDAETGAPLIENPE